VKSLRVHAQLIIAAKRAYLGGAIRLYFLAKNLNSYGWLLENELKAAAYGLGVSKSSYYKWLTDAKAAGFLRYVCDKQGRHLLFVTNYAEVYTILEVSFVDKQAVTIPARDLFAPEWYALVWEGWTAANFNGAVISQDTKQKLSGVPVSTQRRLDRKARIKRIRNYVITETPAANVAAFREFSGRRGIFRVGDWVAFTVPSLSVVEPGRVEPIGTKRLRRNMSAIVRSYSTAGTGDAARRVFCVNDVQVKKAEGEGYRFMEHHEAGFNVWRAIN
jgi:hypothetical protein